MPKKIGKYQIVKSLGSGAYGRVKKAIHLVTNQIYAIKIIKKQKIIEDNMLNSIKAQIFNMINCDHRNIVKLYEVFSSQKHLYLVMQYVQGQVLIDKINQKIYTEDQSKKHFYELCSAIHYLKSKNIAHRDIKADNIVIDRNNELKLLDFGLSVFLKEVEVFQTEMQTQCGTLDYIAPEILKREKYDPFASDIWSLGVLLYCLLHGTAPFDSENVMTLINNILNSELSLSPLLTEQARDLIMSMLNVNPEKRITIENVLNHQWLNEKSEMRMSTYSVKPLTQKKSIIKQDSYHNEGDYCCKRLTLIQFTFYLYRMGINKILDRNQRCMILKNRKLAWIIERVSNITNKQHLNIKLPDFKFKFIFNSDDVDLEAYYVTNSICALQIQSSLDSFQKLKILFQV